MRSLKAFALRWAGSQCVSRCGSGPRWACSEREPGEGAPNLSVQFGYSDVSVSSERPRPIPVSPPHSVDPQHTFVVTHDTRKSLSANASPPLQPRPAGSPPGAVQPLSSPRPMCSSRRTATASPTQRCLPLDAAALLLHAARTTFGAQPQLPPGFFPHPATPPFQFGRTGRDRRSGPDSAAGVGPGRHFVSRDGSGAARERGRFHEVTRRRRFPGVARIVKTTSSTRSGHSNYGRMTEGSRALSECDRHLDARSHAHI
ncbi:hypothetical protein NDU88_006048 [Pleurodeles waltl]|uniref:Uncharacterized protein n=1 Tax=Pleurodeles waltl TaxID=8319 RepID=A0AAV7RP04_PLEWA|nr:hypothetical protein NDU88_006048 [Pleurodeles waltl]